MTKNLTLLILSMLFFQVVKAQVRADTTKNNNDQIFAAVEQEPEFKNDGQVSFSNFLAQNVKYPLYDRENKISGKVIATFVVEKDGKITNIKTLRSPDKSLGDAVTEAIQQSPPWKPGIQNGQPVRVQYTIAFSFNL